MVKKPVVIVLALISILFNFILEKEVFAQDPQFTQFYANPLYLNPAFAGTSRCPRLIMNYRNQWPGLTGTYVTYAASYDQHVDAIGGGIGVSVFHDRAGEGTLNTTNASLMYAYDRPINRHFSIRAALQATFFQKAIDWDKLTFGDMIDARYGFVYQTQETPITNSKSGVDFSAGILGFSKKFYGGFAAHHLTQPDEGLIGPSKLPMKYTVHAGAIIPLNRNVEESSISPNVLFMQQDKFQQVNMGIYVTKGSIVGGLWYRKDDSFIILVGFTQGMFKIGYSFDVTVSKLGLSNSYGSHEVSFALQFDCKPKKRKFRTISCPSF